MSDKRDYYEVLGVTRDADGATIKKAYRKLAVELHPDRNPGDAAAEEGFKEAASAYQTLSDPERRAMYDRFGHDGPRGGGPGGFSDVGDIFSAFGDIFGDMFGGRGGGRSTRGADVETRVKMTLAEAAVGVTKEIEVARRVACTTCAGSGAAPGSKPERCRTCRGAGQVMHSQGFLMIQTACPDCRGAGQVIKTPCPECRGGGLQRQVDKLQVSIPAGVDDGSTLRMTGRGETTSVGGRAGNLYVHIEIEPDPRFEREGVTLHAALPLTFVQAALGAELKVATLEGEQTVTIEPGTQPGDEIVIKRMGMPDVQGGRRGDLIVHCQVLVPRKLGKEQAESLRAFAATLGDSDGTDGKRAGGFFWGKKKGK